MAIYYATCSVISAGSAQSVVASAAYQASEKLVREADGKTKDYRHSHNEVMWKEGILLPEYAPAKFADRSTLWNNVEAFELKKNRNAQFARRWIFALPKEIPVRDYERIVREFCQKVFVARGMIIDYAIHLNEGNPHFHVLTTMRPLKKDGSWGSKAKKVFDLDARGDRIPVLDKKGNQKKERNGKRIWKSHKECATNWDAKETLASIRTAWADAENHALQKFGFSIRISEKAYEEQGIDRIPQVKMGAAAAMEKRGTRTMIGDINRVIRKRNEVTKMLESMVDDLAYNKEIIQQRKIEIVRLEKQIQENEVILQKQAQEEAAKKQAEQKRELEKWKKQRMEEAAKKQKMPPSDATAFTVIDVSKASPKVQDAVCQELESMGIEHYGAYDLTYRIAAAQDAKGDIYLFPSERKDVGWKPGQQISFGDLRMQFSKMKENGDARAAVIAAAGKSATSAYRSSEESGKGRSSGGGGMTIAQNEHPSSQRPKEKDDLGIVNLIATSKKDAPEDWIFLSETEKEDMKNNMAAIDRL